MATAKVICVFKHKEDTLFKVYDYGHCLFCELEWVADWSQFDNSQRELIAKAFKLSKQFETIEEFKEETYKYTGDYHFVWED